MEHADNRMVSSGERYRGKDILGKTALGKLGEIWDFGTAPMLSSEMRR